MADIKTLVEEAKIALGIALDSAEYCGHSLAGTMTLRRATEDREDVIKALDALAEAYQAEVARLTRERDEWSDRAAEAQAERDAAREYQDGLTRENEGLAKAARDVCEHIHGEFPRTGYLRDNYNSRAALGRLRAALAGASEGEHGKA